MTSTKTADLAKHVAKKPVAKLKGKTYDQGDAVIAKVPKGTYTVTVSKYQLTMNWLRLSRA